MLRLIDANELIENIRKKLGIKNLDYLLPSEKRLIEEIEKAKPIEAIPIEWLRDYKVYRARFQNPELEYLIDKMIKDWREQWK